MVSQHTVAGEAITAFVFTVTSAAPAKVLVVYTPPYGEDPGNVVRG